jgi:hypothetical protein
MTDTHSHPSPEMLAKFRAREPGAVLLFPVEGGTFAAFDGDAPRFNRLLGAASGTVFYAGPGDERWVTFAEERLDPLLASIADAGGRAVVCEPVAPAGPCPCPGCSGTGLVWYAAGGSRPCPRCLGSGRADATGADVAGRWEC